MNGKYLILKERKELEALYLQGMSVIDIAAKLQVHRSTVYNELKRGDTGEMDCNGRTGYSAELAQRRAYEMRRTAQRGEKAVERAGA